MAPPGWLQGIWLTTGLCLAWLLGAVGTWAGFTGGPASGGLVAVMLLWGALAVACGSTGRSLGAWLQAAASGGAMAALVIGGFGPLLEAWVGPSWFELEGVRAVVAASAGTVCGALWDARAGDPRLPFPDASALAEALRWPAGLRFGLAGAALMAAVARWGVLAGWWPGVVTAGGGPSWSVLLGLSVVPGLLGLGMILGRERVRGLAGGSLAVAAVLVPAALVFGPDHAVAPALRPGAAAGGLELQESFGFLLSLGAGAVAAVAVGLPALSGWLRRLWRDRPRTFRLQLQLRRFRRVWGGLLAALLVCVAVAGLGGGQVRWTAGAVASAAASGALAAGMAATSLVQLGGLAWVVLGLVPLGAASIASAWYTAGLRLAEPVPSSLPAFTLTVAALSLTVGLFAADYWQTVRLNLLLETRFPVFPVKLASALAGLSGALFAASALEAAVPFQPAAVAGLAGRTTLAGLTGQLPAGLILSGAGLGVVAWLLGRPVWPLALGALLPLPWALTLLVGALIARPWPQGARTIGFGLLLGDLALQGVCLLTSAWGMMQGKLRWVEAARPAGTPRGFVALAVLALVAGLTVWLSRMTERSRPAAGLSEQGEPPAGNAVASG